MNSIVKFLFLISSILLVSCNFEKAKPEVSKSVESLEVPLDYVMMNQEETAAEEIKIMRNNALAVLNHRQKEQNNKSFTIIVNNFWKYDGAVKNSDFIKSDKLQGKWIAYKEDLTYEYGDYNEKKGSGRYFFDLEKNILLMLDDHPNIKPQEFEVKLTNDMMVLVGAYVYNDNNLQTKLSRISEKPTKQ